MKCGSTPSRKRKGLTKDLITTGEFLSCQLLVSFFEKLIKNRIMDTLQGTMSHFQNGGMRGKGVVDNLFIL